MVITNLVKDESQIKFLLGVLLSVAIIAPIGTFQFFDMDIFRTDLKFAIMPKNSKHPERGWSLHSQNPMCIPHSVIPTMSEAM